MPEHDPLDALRLSLTAESPRPEFARGLRARVEAELRPQPPKGTTMQLVPYITVHDGHAAIDWYRDAFGAELVGDVIPMGDLVGHAELSLGGARFFLSDEAPEHGVRSPRTLGGTPFAMHLEVPDVDATFARAVSLGATVQREPADAPYGFRGGVLFDPFGHRWMIQTPLAERHATGDRFAATELWNEVGYYTIAVPDPARARSFYNALFGWELPEPTSEGAAHLGMHNDSTKVPMGVNDGVADRNPRLYFRVRDLDTMVEKVRSLGGEVVRVDQYASGGNAVVRDDQGVEFDLWQPAEGY